MSEHGWPGWPDGEHGDPHDADVGAHHDAAGWAEPGWPDPAGHGHDDPLVYHDAGDEAGTSWPGHDEPGVDAGPVGGGGWEPLSHLHDTAGPDALPHGDDAHHGADAPVGADPGYAMGHVGADPDALADHPPWHDVFPLPVEVGALPEPVDGFPWIDPASLGGPDHVADPAAAAEPRPDPAELATYAGVEVSGEGDPWQQLAAVDDPATSALARFWQPPD